MTVYLVFVVVYLVALLAVGAVKARQISSQADFSLAGRALPVWVLVGTLLATWIGTGSIFGNAEETYRVGAAAFLLPISGGLGIIALYFLAARIRRLGEFTIQDILEQRFGPAARVIGTITLLSAYVIIVSYQYRAGAAVVERVWPGLGSTGAVFAVALFVITYTALAGMFSVAYTDVANGVLMTVGIAVALPILIDKAGGVSAMFAALEPSQARVWGHYGFMDLLGVLLPALLLLLGDANMYQRFFSARDPAAARRSAAGMFVGVVVLELAIIATALAGASLVRQGVISAPENAGHIVVQVAFEALPAFLGAMLVATVVAVVVSTADSYLLSPATSLVRDVYQRFVAPEADEKRLVFIGRLVVVGLGVLALGLAFTSDRFFRVALFAYTIYGAGITPALLAALLWRRASPEGAIASMITGVVTATFWKFLVVDQGLLSIEIHAVVPAILLSVVVLVVVSLLTEPATATLSEPDLSARGSGADE